MNKMQKRGARAMAMAVLTGLTMGGNALAQAQYVPPPYLAFADAGQVRVLADAGSFYVNTSIGGHGDTLWPEQASVVNNGLLFKPTAPGYFSTTTIGVQTASSPGAYADSSSWDVRLKGLFLPKQGYQIHGFRVTVTGTVQADGTGSASMYPVLSFADHSVSGDTSLNQWQNLGNNLQAFTLTRDFQTSALNVSRASAPEVAIGLVGNVSSTYARGFCYVYCMPDRNGTATLNLGTVRIEALVSPTSAVPEASSLLLSLAGLATVVDRRRRRAH